MAGLAGRSFELVGLVTDAGGIDTMSEEAEFVLHFVDGAATADTQCGQLIYPSIRYSTAPGVGELRVDLGDFSGPTCALGADPADPPSGLLGFGKAENGEFFLSTSYVGWQFREIGN